MATTQRVEITAPKMETVAFTIRGTSPLVIHAFSRKTREQMKASQEQGDKAKNRKKREPKDFKALCEGAKHKAADGWCGIPANALRAGMISVCRLTGFVMTRAKLAIFIEADGFDAEDFTPLVKITKGQPEYFESMVRLSDGSVDISARPLWKPGWEAVVRVSYDTDQMSREDIGNLLMRLGRQAGICEGRPNSTNSTGQGWGLFELVQDKEAKKR